VKGDEAERMRSFHHLTGLSGSPMPYDWQRKKCCQCNGWQWQHNRHINPYSN